MSAPDCPLMLADVVRLLAHTDEEDVARWLRLLQGGRQPAASAVPTWVQPSQASDPALPAPRVATPTPTPTRANPNAPLQAPQYRVVRAEPWVPAAELEPTPSDVEQTPMVYGPLVSGPAADVPLAPRRRWWPALKRQRPPRLRGIDVTQWARQSALARWPQHPPRRQDLGTWQHCVVVVDTSHAQTPFRRDFETLLQELRRLHLATHLDVRYHDAGPTALQLPRDADAVLLLSDLGASTHDPHASAQQWLACLHDARRRGLPLMAWVSAHASRISRCLLAHLHIIAWHEGSDFRPVQPAHTLPVHVPAAEPDVSALLTRLSMALSAHPALLRRMRWLCPEAQQHPEWEAWLWAMRHDQAVAGTCVVKVLPQHAPFWRKRYAQLSAAQQQALYLAITTEHQHGQRSSLFVERLLLHAYAHPDMTARWQSDVDEAKQWLAQLHQLERTHQARAAALGNALGNARREPLHGDFQRDCLQRLETDPQVVRAYEHLLSDMGADCNHRPHGVSEVAWLQASGAHLSQPVPSSASALACHYPEGRATFAVLPQSAMGLSAQEAWLSPAGHWRHMAWDTPMQRIANADTDTASWPAQANVLTLVDAQGLHRLHLAPLSREPWQQRLGRDRYGLFADLCIPSVTKGHPPVTQRLRHIPPGTFLMGSPDGVGDDDEHPQHPVTLTDGYWLADTPCTQALWQAVMGDNPSHFQSGADAPRRPVEQVAYEGEPGQDVQTFLQRLQAQLPQGVKAGLPTEAEWEYACRAGTPTAYWWGNDFDATKANADTTDDKRWDAEEGTTPVDRYAPNPWGLYDMHGNVWEWCADAGYRTYGEQAVVNPVGEADRGARVVRGGSWIYRVGNARAAYRTHWRLGGRDRNLGFRLLLRSSGPGPEGGQT